MRDNSAYNIVVTNDCMIRCGHCFMDRKAVKSLDLDTVKAITAKILSFDRTQDINWGGGEPLILGRGYLRGIVSLECFEDPGTRNLLYSTYQIQLDNDWIDILNRFHALMFSIDSYRRAQTAFNSELALANLTKLSPKKHVSYTPMVGDTPGKVAQYYEQALDIGAEMFHVGFLYSRRLIPPATYLRLIDDLLDLQVALDGPEIGFFHKSHAFGGDYKSAVGWRGYDCFDKGTYFSHDGIVTSCFIMYSLGFDVPHIRIEEFLSEDKSLFELNRKYVAEFFIRSRAGTCLECSYYTLCMGGCPYFTSRSETGVDYYCEVYKKIFGILLGRDHREVRA
ncbi:MAG: SPASM domain-containing protein [Nitrospirota bacterium]